MASLDVYRPAAQEQLAVLGRDLSIDTLPVVAGQMPTQIAQRALQAGKLGRLRRCVAGYCRSHHAR